MEENKLSFDEQLEKLATEETPESQAQPAEDAPTEEPKKKKSKVGLILGIIFGSIALVTIALVLFFTLKDNKDLTRNKFINEIGGVSETFIGAVSQNTYESATDAASDFVYREVVGDSYATVKSVSSLGNATASEHNIPEEFLDGSMKVEKVEVEFTVPSKASLKREVQLLSTSDGGETEAKVVVYVIKYSINDEDYWRYFAPMPVTGETISKSYYDSVFDNEKYKNCTYEMTQTSKSSTFGITAAEYTIHQLYKFDDGKIYIEQTEEMKSLGETTVNTLFFYAEEHANGYIECYINENNTGWREAELRNIGFYTLEELTPFHDQYFDYTYFTKTDYGFDLPADNARDFFTDVLYHELEGVGTMVSKDDIKVDLYAEYFVREGVLSGMRINSDVKMKVIAEGVEVSVNVDLEAITKVTDYGTTVVEKPVK